MATQSEYELEQALIKQLTENMHYEWVNVHDEASMKANLKRQLEIHNKLTKEPLTEAEFSRIFSHLTQGGTVFERAKTLRDRYPLHRDDGTEKWISFINKEDWCRNEFQVTNQVKQYNVEQQSRRTRFDVTILINGLPLVQIELKRRGLELKEAFNQVNRYHRDAFWVGSGLYLFTQIFIISNGVNTKYYANNRDLSFGYTFFWADEQNEAITNLHDFSAEFLKVCHIAKMITHYTVLNETFKCLMIMRPYQVYACEAIINRVKESDKNGYIWHTTGSGKTLTSFKASQVIMGMEEVDKVLFVVDRRDLDYQTAKEFNAFQKDSVDTTDNTRTLIKQLTSTDNKLILTTLQKLNNAISREKHADKLAFLKDKRIIFIFDECHRSQFGETHKSIKRFFHNAQMFGFTGTPIFEDNINITQGIKQTTEMLFGECLHKYVIVDAIRDENVLRFSVEYVGRYHRKNSANEVDISVKGIDTKEILESDLRLGRITDYILQHHDGKTANRAFTAMFCVGSVDMLIKYYQLFKTRQQTLMDDNPNYKPLKIATIFTYSANEAINPQMEVDVLDEDDISLPPDKSTNSSSRDHLDQFIDDYNQMFGCNYSTNDTKSFYDYYKDIARRVKNREIDILLVVNMFLTGFDSPPLSTLYVDKNLRHHGLIQAFSRTNRIYNEKKRQGNIVCFRNLKMNTDDAIRLFSNKNATAVVLVKPYEEYLSDFREKLAILLAIAPTVESVDKLPDEESQEKFVKAFRELLRVKNILSTFADYKEEDLGTTEQTFADYTSKYLDIYDKVRRPKDDGKTSILDEIDFEVCLIHRDDINVGYILRLLAETQNMSEEKRAERKRNILDIVNSDTRLRSKRELITRFIETNLPHIDDLDNIRQAFETFVDDEKRKAIIAMCEHHHLDLQQVNKIIEDYLFSNVLPRPEQIAEALLVKPKILERERILASATQSIKSLIDTFIDGMDGE